MKKSDELLQKRSAVEDSIQALAEKADLTADERETLRGLHAQVEKLTADIDLERKNEEILKRVADRNAASSKRQENETRSYSIAKAIQDIVMRGKLEGLEAEMHQEALRETPSLRFRYPVNDPCPAEEGRPCGCCLQIGSHRYHRIH